MFATDAVTQIRKIETLEDQLLTNPAFKAPDLQQRYVEYHKKRQIETEIKAIRKQLKVPSRTPCALSRVCLPLTSRSPATMW